MGQVVQASIQERCGAVPPSVAQVGSFPKRSCQAATRYRLDTAGPAFSVGKLRSQAKGAWVVTKNCVICGKRAPEGRNVKTCVGECRAINKQRNRIKWKSNPVRRGRLLASQRAYNAKYNCDMVARRARDLMYSRKRGVVSAAEYLEKVTKPRLPNESKSQAHDRRNREELRDGYIRSLLEMRHEICPPELIALKRAQLQIKRYIKQQKNTTT